MDHKIINLWTNFGAILGSILGPELAPKQDQKWDHFWNPQRRVSGVRKMRKREINESGEKATGAGIIFGKRKGVIRPSGLFKALGGLIRPLRAL